MKAAIRRFVPRAALSRYHRSLAELATRWYGHPSRQLVVIGVTGTSGKTTVSLLLHRMLEQAGNPTAVATTALFVVRDRQTMNDRKMTMLGRFGLQRWLRRAVRAGCTHVIVETTSEGIAQHRHRGIDYDLVVLTNLSPEHIESHGSFAAYQAAKEKLFHGLTLTYRKRGVPKTMVVNADDEASSMFLRHAADRYLTFSMQGKTVAAAEAVLATKIKLSATGSSFLLSHGGEQTRVELQLLGRMNVENCLAAAAAAVALGVPLEVIAEAVAGVTGVPGRLEFMAAGGVTAIVDYAFHAKAMEELYAVVDQLPHRRVIHVLGATGGGRDRARRPVLGRIAGERADDVVVTNEDPYDEDPLHIMDEVLVGVLEISSKHLNENVFRIFDRAQAIAKAVSLASAGDIVLVTGKGSEQAIVVAGGRKVPWDDREAVRLALAQRFSTT
ncbi:MAG: UDP-N-acetylmuramyl-tripeptide synthetase [Candidatus Kerfeldbacteria bacterium]|nr:UDP-N-acetylmuramyl-tripeptide synthetase [Candidatus Kerfeldbacteria bacterium]